MLHWWRWAGTHNLQSYKAIIYATGDLNVALVEMGRDSQSAIIQGDHICDWGLECCIGGVGQGLTICNRTRRSYMRLGT